MSIIAKNTKSKTPDSPFTRMLAEDDFLNIPRPGDAVRGIVLEVSKNVVRIDLPGFRTGVIRGPELKDISGENENIKPEDEVEATVLDIENENGEVELSFKHAGSRRAWDEARRLLQEGATFPTKIIGANKGGLMIRVAGISGFIPVSQLSPDNYPRVPGGDKQKIYEKLRSLIGESINVKLIDANEDEDKLIASEKAVWEEQQKGVISQFNVGDAVEGEVSALTEFGAFIKFDSLEGLVHISELAWQRIDHPKDILKIGDAIKAKIIGIDGSKVFLSIKQLTDDPWKGIEEKYKVGQTVKGKILKVNPFGFFVELDPQIHGLAHISELDTKPVHDLSEIGKEGDVLEWMIVSVEPEQHRLGLSRKALLETEKKET